MTDPDRCDYPGCLGPADGSECRHPRPADEDWQAPLPGEPACVVCGQGGLRPPEGDRHDACRDLEVERA